MVLSFIRMLWSMQKKDLTTSLKTATALTGMFNFYFVLCFCRFECECKVLSWSEVCYTYICFIWQPRPGRQTTLVPQFCTSKITCFLNFDLVSPTHSFSMWHKGCISQPQTAGSMNKYLKRTPRSAERFAHLCEHLSKPEPLVQIVRFGIGHAPGLPWTLSLAFAACKHLFSSCTRARRVIEVRMTYCKSADAIKKIHKRMRFITEGHVPKGCLINVVELWELSCWDQFIRYRYLRHFCSAA